MNEVRSVAGWAGTLLAGLRFAMRSFIIWAWVLVPVAINVSSAGSAGPVWTVALVVAGIAAPILFFVGGDAWRSRRRAAAGLLWLFGFVVLVGANLPNAIKMAAEHRAERADPRAAKISERESMERRSRELDERIRDFRRVAGKKTVFEWRAEVRKSENDPLFQRSDRCQNVTSRTGDSQLLCDQRAEQLQGQQAAERIEELIAERDGIERKLAGMDAPEVADVQTATMKRIFGRYLDIDEKLLAAGLDGVLIVIIELIATFMPAVIDGYLVRKAVTNMQPSLRAAVDAPFAEFVSGTVHGVSGASPANRQISDISEPSAADAAGDDLECRRQGNPTLPALLPETMPETIDGVGGACAAASAASPASAAVTPAEEGLIRWIEKCVIPATGGVFHTTEGSKLYREWCDAEGLKKVDSPTFSRVLKGRLNHAVDRKGKVAFTGYELMGRGLRVVK